MNGQRTGAALLIAAWLLAALLPLIVAAMSGAPGRPGMHDVASTIAMVGFATLLLEFVLSGRVRVLTDPVGMDALMRFHQFSGHVVLALLLLHPYLYALFPAETGMVGGRVVTGSGGSTLSGVTGFVAWFGLIGLVFMAIFRDELPMTYERWRLTHGLGAAAIAVLGLVHTLGAGTAAAVPAVAGFWMIAVALALLTLLHVYAIKPWLRQRHPWRVHEVKALAEDIHELRIEPDGHDGLDFRAGQFGWLRIAPRPEGLREHPFSIASAPGDGPVLRCFICAPPGMIDAMETLLFDLGIPPARIHSERFRYRFSGGSPLARRTRRLYMAVAGVLVLAAVMFAAIA